MISNFSVVKVYNASMHNTTYNLKVTLSNGIERSVEVYESLPDEDFIAALRFLLDGLEEVLEHDLITPRKTDKA